MTGLLDGIRVLDLTTMGTGPYATQILAEYGAEITKLEAPDGDPIRNVGPARHAKMSSMFLGLGAGKRSLALDLRRPEARPVFEQLVARADVVIHNMRDPAAKKLGLSFEDLRKINPGVVHCAILGFDRGGPYTDRPAYDDLIQGLVALPDLMHRSGGETQYVPLAMADRIVGLFAAEAVLAAVVAQLRSGKAQSVVVPMFEALAGFVLGDHLYGRSFVPPEGEMGYPRHLNPYRRPFRTADGHIGVLPYTDQQWQSLFRTLDVPELGEDPRFARLFERSANIAALYQIVAKHLTTRTTAEWLAAFEAADIPAMPTNTLETLIDDPQLKAVGLIREEEHPSEGRILRVRGAVHWDGEDDTAPPPLAPRLGEHGVELLRDAGVGEAEIADLVRAGVLRLPAETGPEPDQDNAQGGQPS
ncbi:CoA transferase [Vannielia sp.]|uniref:CaiB/BaiF CoA transferase family protein n=1 Tax=Vannielia sp. TaxID=2813045 RepID=UPI002618AAE1|nr:CoA transferase [Vannielia sp.]MDF1873951.1 CoA transferase [Vannielia sp.]